MSPAIYETLRVLAIKFPRLVDEHPRGCAHITPRVVALAYPYFDPPCSHSSLPLPVFASGVLSDMLCDVPRYSETTHINFENQTWFLQTRKVSSPFRIGFDCTWFLEVELGSFPVILEHPPPPPNTEGNTIKSTIVGRMLIS